MGTLSSQQPVEALVRVPRCPKTIRYLYRSVLLSQYGLRADYPSLCSTYGARTSLFFQMSLTQKFKDAVSGGAINITSLCIGTRYPVIHCDRIGTKYVDAVRLTIREEAEDIILRVFLPRHYGSAISEDMAAINSRRIMYYLTYKGKSASSYRCMLQMDV